MPTSFLEDLFGFGYECYYISPDNRIPIEKKIEIILSLFKDIILFINIDYEIPGVNWSSIIYDLVRNKGLGTNVGVLYARRKTPYENESIERYFIGEIGIVCGCIQLEYKKNNNLEIIAKMLYANQAQGRRKAIRILCNSAYTYSIDRLSDEPVSGALQDISLSHFSVFIPNNGKQMFKIYEKIPDIHFNIKGFFFRSDAVLYLERKMEAGTLFVFAFMDSEGKSGLDYKTKAFLAPHLYKILSSYSNALMEKAFKLYAENSDLDKSIPTLKEVEEI